MSSRPTISQELLVDPRRFRVFFIILLLGGLLLIGGSYGAGQAIMRETTERDLERDIESKALLLEDQLSRTMDSVTARAAAADALLQSTLRDRRLPRPEELRELIGEDRMVRSLSLVNGVGRVLASSDPVNLEAAVPLRAMPAAGAARLPGLQFGPVTAGRDIADLVAAPPNTENRQPEPPRVWLSTTPAAHPETGMRWVLALNPELLMNLWARLSGERHLEVGLFDFRGECLLANPAPPERALGWGQLLSQRSQERAIGMLDAPGREAVRISYRASTQHPLILAVWTDLSLLHEEPTPSLRALLAMALLSLLALLVLLVLLWRWYRRYEISALDAANKTRAIDNHLLTSVWSPAGVLVDCNDALLRVSGYTRDELVGSKHTLFRSDVHDEDYYDQIRETLRRGLMWTGTLCLSRKSGEIYWVNATIQPYLNASDRVTNFMALFTDITESKSLLARLSAEEHLREELRRENANLSQEALTDPLTRLPNRRALYRYVDQLLRAPHGADDGIAVLQLDLDHFKRINDTYGHLAGDTVLRTMAERWARLVRASDLIVRMGGEEFCVVLPRAMPEQALRVAEKMRTACSDAPVMVDLPAGPTALSVTTSVGVCHRTLGTMPSLEQLLKRADDALYEAKRGGRNRCVLANDANPTASADAA